MHQESKFDVLCPGIAQNINLTKQPDHETKKSLLIPQKKPLKNKTGPYIICWCNEKMVTVFMMHMSYHENINYEKKIVINFEACELIKMLE